MHHRPIALVAGVVLALTVAACGGGGDLSGFGGGDGGSSAITTDAGHVATPGDAGHDAVTKAPTKDAGHDAAVHDSGSSHDSAKDTSVPPKDSGHDVGVPPFDSGPGVVDATPPHHDAFGPPQIPIVYGQSAAILYSVNPDTDAVTTIGPFIGCDSSGVIDIALDKSSVMYATTGEGVYTVDTSNAVCTLLASGTTYPNSLSFVPAGTLDPSAEALVGYQGSSYVQINTTTGAMTTVGSLGDTYTSSGDIVSVIGGGTYLTVTGGTDCVTYDCLVEVNPATGALITNYGSVKHSEVYGLAFWAGNVYGFDNGGDLFEVSFPDAGGLAIKTIPIPNPPLFLSFYGAGSTTAAPKR